MIVVKKHICVSTILLSIFTTSCFNSTSSPSQNPVPTDPLGDTSGASGSTGSGGVTSASSGSTSNSGAIDSGPSTIKPVLLDKWIVQFGSVTKIPGVVDANKGYDYCFAMAVDDEQNSYCAGSTNGNLGEKVASFPFSNSDAFILKLNKHGQIVWLTQLGATTAGADAAGSDGCRSIAIDKNKDVICGGVTSGNLGEANGGESDAFVLKLDSNGKKLWVRQLGAVTLPVKSTGSEFCASIALDSGSNIYCVGTSGNIGELNGDAPVTGYTDGFIAKINSDGTFGWVKQFGSVTLPEKSKGSDEFKSIAIDVDDNIYIGGSTVQMGEKNCYYAGCAYTTPDAFVMKLNLAAEIIWIRQLGAVTMPFKNEGTDICNAVAVDASRDVYCVGTTTRNLGDENGAGYNSSGHDVFFVKLLADGTVAWLTQLGGTKMPGKSSGADVCGSLAVDGDKNIFAAGRTTGGLGEVNAGGSDAVIIKMNPDGTLGWVKQFGSVTKKAGVPNANTGSDVITGIALDKVGNIYAGGHVEAVGRGANYAFNGNFGEVCTSLDVGMISDFFVLKMDSQGEFQ